MWEEDEHKKEEQKKLVQAVCLKKEETSCRRFNTINHKKQGFNSAKSFLMDLFSKFIAMSGSVAVLNDDILILKNINMFAETEILWCADHQKARKPLWHKSDNNRKLRPKRSQKNFYKKLISLLLT